MISLLKSPLSRAVLALAGLAITFSTAGYAAKPTAEGSAKKAEGAAKKKSPITKPKFDPNAERVGVFKGIDSGSLTVKMVAKDSMGGSLYIENHSDKPLTVELPDAFVGVQVLRQFGGGQGGAGGGTAGGAGGGGAQAVGGGGGGGGGFGGGGGGGGFGGGGGGAFSVPPEQIVKVPFNSVCLEHGKREPNARLVYQITPVSDYSKNPELAPLLSMVGKQQVDPKAAQAAAWNIESGMNWDQLATKKDERQLTGNKPPYFTAAAIFKAKQLVAESQGIAREQAAEREKKGEKEEDRPAPRRPLAQAR